MASDTGRGVGLLIARCSLAALFWYTGIASILDTAGTTRQLTGMGYPIPQVLAWVSAAAQLGGALSLTLGVVTPVGCLALILFMLPTTWSFHLPAALKGDAMQVIETGKNLAIVGGLIALLFTGPGRFSIDRRIQKGNQR